jgi:gamma-glutamyltranspeptidase/glutathione hydrolase
LSAASPAAVAAALPLFEQGGNAFDVAVAAALAETVALPMKCGLAGDVVALIRKPGGKLRTLISVGPGPLALADGATLDKTGPCSIGVPGAPDGYAALAAMGRLGLERMAGPAIEASARGIEWTRIGVDLTRQAETLLRRWNGDTVYLPKGQPPKTGDTLYLPGMTALLREFAHRGAELFFDDIGRDIATHVRSAGGFLTPEDLRVRPARWLDPDSRILPGGETTLWATPAPTHGPALLRAVELVSTEGADPVDAALQARAEHKADSMNSGTSVVSAADDEGNAVVIVHSNSFPQFGSGLVVEAWNLVLNNRPGRGFDLDAPPESSNAPRAGRTPHTTLHAWALELAGQVYLGATPGGANQMIWNLQSILDCLDGSEPGAVCSAPRWAMDEAGAVSCEADHAYAARERARTIAPLSLRSAQQLLRLGTDGVIAAADPRTGAQAEAA